MQLLDSDSAITQGRIIRVIDGDGQSPTYNITVEAKSGNSIEGSSSVTIRQAYGSVMLQSSGTVWHVIGGSFISGTQNTVPVFNGDHTLSDSIITQPTATNISVGGNAAITNNLTITGNVAVDTNTFVVDSANSLVGIGTVSPLSLLHVNAVTAGSWDNTGGLRVGGYYTGSSSTGVHLQIGGNQTTHGWIQAFEDSNVSGSAGSVKSIVLQPSGGNVGIGKTSPAVALDVVGAVAVGDNLTVTGNVAVDTNTFVVDATNNRVGIHTTSILGDLHINSVTTDIWDNDTGLRVGGYYNGSSSTGVHVQIGSNQTSHG